MVEVRTPGSLGMGFLSPEGGGNWGSRFRNPKEEKQWEQIIVPWK
jgi:hypothetical protein